MLYGILLGFYLFGFWITFFLHMIPSIARQKLEEREFFKATLMSLVWPATWYYFLKNTRLY